MLGERRLAKGFHLSKARRDGQMFNSDPSGPKIPRQRKGNENSQPTFRPTTFILRGVGENAIESNGWGTWILSYTRKNREIPHQSGRQRSATELILDHSIGLRKRM